MSATVDELVEELQKRGLFTTRSDGHWLAGRPFVCPALRVDRGGTKCRDVFCKTARLGDSYRKHLEKKFHSDDRKTISYHNLDELDELTDEQLDAKREQFVQQGLENLN